MGDKIIIEYRFSELEAEQLFARQLEIGWNVCLDPDHRLFEAFRQGFSFARALKDK